jgi:hypothetical protein
MQGVLVVCVVVGMAGSAWGQGAGDKTAAKAHYDLAERLYAQARYDEAIVEYRAAYELVPDPELEYDIAQALRKKGDVKQALDAYRHYLELDPRGRGAKHARRSIAQLEQTLHPSEASPAGTAPGPGAEAAAAPPTGPTSSGPSEVTPPPSPLVAQKPAPRASSRRLAVGFIASGALLAAGATATGIAYLSARGTVDHHCGAQLVCDHTGFTSAGTAGHLATATTVMWVAAAAAAGVGGYFLLRRPAAQIQVMPAWAPGAQGPALLAAARF